jgi:sulfate transport system permease protein
LFVTLPLVVRTVQPVLLELDEAEEEAARVLGATRWYVFRRVVLPKLRAGIAGGGLLAFARAIGEFGSLVLLAGNTQIASIYIFAKIESGDTEGAAAVSVVLLVAAIAILLVIGRFARRGLPV